jgi:hypothetical protein
MLSWMEVREADLLSETLAENAELKATLEQLSTQHLLVLEQLRDQEEEERREQKSMRHDFAMLLAEKEAAFRQEQKHSRSQEATLLSRRMARALRPDASLRTSFKRTALAEALCAASALLVLLGTPLALLALDLARGALLPSRLHAVAAVVSAVVGLLLLWASLRLRTVQQARDRRPDPGTEHTR